MQCSSIAQGVIQKPWLALCAEKLTEFCRPITYPAKTSQAFYHAGVLAVAEPRLGMDADLRPSPASRIKGQDRLRLYTPKFPKVFTHFDTCYIRVFSYGDFFLLLLLSSPIMVKFPLLMCFCPGSLS